MRYDIPIAIAMAALAIYFIISAFSACQPVNRIEGWKCNTIEGSSSCVVIY